MASIRPFRGIRYNRSKVGGLSAVTAPPYDVISPDEQERYRELSPYNVVRLILPQGNEDEYRNAADCLHDWMDAGVLVRDTEPCIYAVEQEFEAHGDRMRRLGIVCLMRLEDYGTTVLPHENVLSKPREDRLNLIRATRANFDSVFGLYADGRIEEVLDPYLHRAPETSAVDKDGVHAELIKICDPKAIEAAASILSEESVVIADGHHRYAAALAYRDEMRSRGNTDPNAPHEFIMMTLVSLDDPGLVVLPTHRLVRNLENFDAERLLEKLDEYFEVEDSSPAVMMEELEAWEGHAFGLYLGGKAYLIELRPSVIPEEVLRIPGSSALKQLDVSILHSLILEDILGIDGTRLSEGSNITYTREESKAVQMVDSGEYQMAFFMKAPRVDEVKAVASAGDRMPQKSTFFYPKLLTGLVMRVMDTTQR